MVSTGFDLKITTYLGTDIMLNTKQNKKHRVRQWFIQFEDISIRLSIFLLIKNTAHEEAWTPLP